MNDLLAEVDLSRPSDGSIALVEDFLVYDAAMIEDGEDLVHRVRFWNNVFATVLCDQVTEGYGLDPVYRRN